MWAAGSTSAFTERLFRPERLVLAKPAAARQRCPGCLRFFGRIPAAN